MPENHIADFITYCTASGLSPITIAWYHGNLKQFAKFIRFHNYRDPKVIREFIADLQTRQIRWQDHPNKPAREGTLSPETIRSYIRTLKCFFHWMLNEEIITSDPTKHLKMPKRKKRIPRGIEEKDFQALIKAIAGIWKKRDHALLMLLRDTGCRASEIVNLCKRDVDLKKGVALVRGKGGQERFVFLSSPTVEVLNDWITEHPEDDQLFQSSQGEFTTNSLRQTLGRLRKRAGITGRSNAHSFRHAFARDWLLSGGDLASLSQYLGHSDIISTMQYATFTIADLQEKHQKHSPLAQHNS